MEHYSKEQLVQALTLQKQKLQEKTASCTDQTSEVSSQREENANLKIAREKEEKIDLSMNMDELDMLRREVISLRGEVTELGMEVRVKNEEMENLQSSVRMLENDTSTKDEIIKVYESDLAHVQEEQEHLQQDKLNLLKEQENRVTQLEERAALADKEMKAKEEELEDLKATLPHLRNNNVIEPNLITITITEDTLNPSLHDTRDTSTTTATEEVLVNSQDTAIITTTTTTTADDDDDDKTLDDSNKTSEDMETITNLTMELDTTKQLLQTAQQDLQKNSIYIEKSKSVITALQQTLKSMQNDHAVILHEKNDKISSLQKEVESLTSDNTSMQGKMVVFEENISLLENDKQGLTQRVEHLRNVVDGYKNSTGLTEALGLQVQTSLGEIVSLKRSLADEKREKLEIERSFEVRLGLEKANWEELSKGREMEVQALHQNAIQEQILKENVIVEKNLELELLTQQLGEIEEKSVESVLEVETELLRVKQDQEEKRMELEEFILSHDYKLADTEERQTSQIQQQKEQQHRLDLHCQELESKVPGIPSRPSSPLLKPQVPVNPEEEQQQYASQQSMRDAKVTILEDAAQASKEQLVIYKEAILRQQEETAALRQVLTRAKGSYSRAQVNVDYLKNILVRYIQFEKLGLQSECDAMSVVLATMLSFSPEERKAVTIERASGWGNWMSFGYGATDRSFSTLLAQTNPGVLDEFTDPASASQSTVLLQGQPAEATLDFHIPETNLSHLNL